MATLAAFLSAAIVTSVALIIPMAMRMPVAVTALNLMELAASTCGLHGGFDGPAVPAVPTVPAVPAVPTVPAVPAAMKAAVRVSMPPENAHSA